MYRRLTSPNFIFACLLGLITTLLVPKLALAALVTPHDLPGGGVESTQDLAEKIRIQKNIDSQLQENNSTLYYSALDVPSKTTIQPILLWNPSIASRANVMSQIVGGITVSLGKMKSFYEAQIPGSRIDVGQVIVAQSSKTYPADCFDSNKVFQHSECGSMSQEILDDAMNRFMVGGGVLNVVYLPGSRHTRQLAAYTWKTDKSKAIAYVRHDAVPNIGLLDPNYDQGINSSSDQAVTHELGHGMGLAHSFPNSLMGGVGSAFSDIVLFNSASYPEKYVACNSSYNAGAKSCSFVSPTASNFQQATVTGRLSCKFNKSMIRTSPVSGTFKICEAIKGSSTYYPDETKCQDFTVGEGGVFSISGSFDFSNRGYMFFEPGKSYSSGDPYFFFEHPETRVRTIGNEYGYGSSSIDNAVIRILSDESMCTTPSGVSPTNFNLPINGKVNCSDGTPVSGKLSFVEYNENLRTGEKTETVVSQMNLGNNGAYSGQLHLTGGKVHKLVIDKSTGGQNKRFSFNIATYYINGLDIYPENNLGNMITFAYADRTLTINCNAGTDVQPTLPPTATPTNTPTSTPTLQPTDTPTPTHTPTPTNTPVPGATNTPVPTATNTPRPTNTPVPTATNTPRPTNTPTSTPTLQPTDTPTPTHTPTPTNTPVPGATNTPVPTATNTPRPTNTPIPTATPRIGDPCTLLIWSQNEQSPKPITGTLVNTSDGTFCQGGNRDNYISYYSSSLSALNDLQTAHYPCQNAGSYVGQACVVNDRNGKKLCVGGPEQEYVGCLYQTNTTQYYRIISGPNPVPPDVTPTPTPLPTNTPAPAATSTPTSTPGPTATNTPIPTATPIPATITNFIDLYWGSASNYATAAYPYNQNADFNRDNVIDLKDYAAWWKN